MNDFTRWTTTELIAYAETITERANAVTTAVTPDAITDAICRLDVSLTDMHHQDDMTAEHLIERP